MIRMGLGEKTASTEPSRGTFSKVSPDWSKQLKCDMHVTFLSCNLIGQPTLPVKFKHKQTQQTQETRETQETQETRETQET